MVKKETYKESNHKPVIETLINTAAITMATFGISLMTTPHNESCYVKGCLIRGLALLLVAAGLEFFKYWGRKNKYW